jgi:uncharacterized RDD family membrane protein YckC
MPLATIGTRAAAFLIDFTLVLAMVIAIGLPFAYQQFRSGAAEHVVVPFEPLHSLWGLIALVLYFGFATYIGHGQTIGKRLLRIRIISLSGSHLTLWQSIERALGYGASALEAGFGFFQALWYHNRQTVHDRIAETIVIKVERAKPPKHSS